MDLAELRRTTGMVIPVYFSPQVEPSQIEVLLRATMTDWQNYVRAENVVLVVDGCLHVIEPLEQVRHDLGGEGWQIVVQEENTGKGGAVCTGIERLVEQGKCEFITQRDADNDHLLIDLPNLWRLAWHIRRERHTDLVVVTGRRNSRHFPLSFARGEWEKIVHEVLMEAVKFTLARQGRVPDWRYCAFYANEPPDIETGYKVFTAQAAALACRALREAHAQDPEAELLRYGWESTNCLEVLLAGGILGEVTRLTYMHQPTSGYTGDYTKLYAVQLPWILRRCGITGDAARTLLDNAISRSLLLTEEPFRKQLMELRRWVLEKVGASLEPLDKSERFF